MQWADISAALQNYLEAAPVGGVPTPDFTAAIPIIVANAELRIYTELDFLATRGVNVTIATTPGSRVLNLGSLTANNLFILDDPSLGVLNTGVLGGGTEYPTILGYSSPFAYPVAVERISLLPESGSTTWIDLLRVSLDMLDLLWPNSAQTMTPTSSFGFWAMQDHQTAVLAPTPGAAYEVRITGTWRPAPMSATQPQTWLGDFYPQLLFAACMVEATGYIRNFGAQSDDPRMAVSWEAEYQRFKAAAVEEEQRRKGQGPGWQPFQPAPLAGSPRR